MKRKKLTSEGKTKAALLFCIVEWQLRGRLGGGHIGKKTALEEN